MEVLRQAVVALLIAWLVPVAAAQQRCAGSPWPRHVVDSSSVGADGVRMADLNGDRHFDIVTGWEEGGEVRIYLHPGPGQVRGPWPRATVGQVESVEDAMFMDVDQDGRLDAVSAAEGEEQTVFVHWAPPENAHLLVDSMWTTQEMPASRKTMRWMYTYPLQIDQMHGADFFAGGKGEGAAVGWFEAPPHPDSLAGWRWREVSAAGWVMSLVPFDLDRDGDMDVVLSDRRGELQGCRWLENPGPEAEVGARWPSHPIGGHGEEVMFMTLADLNRDRHLDVVSATRGHVLLYLEQVPGDSLQWEQKRIDVPESAGTAKSVKVADMNGDGALDIVVTTEQAEGKVGVFWMTRPTDSSAWAFHDISGRAGIKFDLAQLIDLDEDGDLDVLTCEERAGLGVVWYENPLF